ncbi:ABC transporter permease [Faucicola mancuniensis]|uniref:ABC transporter permease n=1 Tax=Faucicola mancuniensis TaxID=1309795 RepID=UPI003977570E
MSLLAFFGALESGLIYALVALGVYISFRVLDFPDLTADGSFPLGGAVAGVSIIAGFNPWVACIFGMLAGGLAGIVTAWLHVKLGILQLLASILVMVALYSVNLRIMDAPNLPLLGEPTVFEGLVNDSNGFWMRCAVIGGVVIGVKLLLDWFFSTETGLAMRATGSNLRMSQAQGIHTSRTIIIGMAISNALIALAGALFVQTQGGADISIGVGTIVIGLAAVIIGETIMPSKRMLFITLSVIIGAILYKLFIQIALSSDTLREIGFGPQDLNLITALLVVIALILPKIKANVLKKRTKNVQP